MEELSIILLRFSSNTVPLLVDLRILSIQLLIIDDALLLEGLLIGSIC